MRKILKNRQKFSEKNSPINSKLIQEYSNKNISAQIQARLHAGMPDDAFLTGLSLLKLTSRDLLLKV